MFNWLAWLVDIERSRRIDESFFTQRELDTENNSWSWIALSIANDTPEAQRKKKQLETIFQEIFQKQSLQLRIQALIQEQARVHNSLFRLENQQIPIGCHNCANL